MSETKRITIKCAIDISAPNKIVDLIAALTTALASVPASHRDAAVAWINAWEGDYGCSCDMECYYDRPETAEERAERLSKIWDPGWFPSLPQVIAGSERKGLDPISLAIFRRVSANWKLTGDSWLDYGE